MTAQITEITKQNLIYFNSITLCDHLGVCIYLLIVFWAPVFKFKMKQCKLPSLIFFKSAHWAHKIFELYLNNTCKIYFYCKLLLVSKKVVIVFDMNTLSLNLICHRDEGWKPELRWGANTAGDLDSVKVPLPRGCSLIHLLMLSICLREEFCECCQRCQQTIISHSPWSWSPRSWW